jgi:gluconokinase
LDHLGVDKKTLPHLTDVSAACNGLLPRFAARWPALAKVPWFPAIGDGAAANLGSAKPDAPYTVVITLGTTGAVRAVIRRPLASIPDGLWCYRVDRQRLLPGGALTEGGNVCLWMHEALRFSDPSRLEGDIATMGPDAHGLTVLPFFAGERSPGWRGRATATVHGLSLATTPLEMLRAGMESVALRLGLLYDRLVPLLALPSQADATPVPIVAGGGALIGSPAWAQILADVLGQRVELSGLAETSSRGVSLLALSLVDAAPDPTSTALPTTVLHPDSEAHAIYRSARERQARLYRFIRENDDTDTKEERV